MAGDRGLAFAMIGLIGATIVWVGESRTHAAHARPAISASATPGKISKVKAVLHPAPSYATDGAFRANDANPLATPFD